MTDSIEPQQPGDAVGRDDDAVITRSEEQLRIMTYRRETQRARLTRFVETETVTRTVEVRHERVRIDYEPIVTGEDAGRSVTGGIGGERWMVLYDEEVVLTTRRVPRERVRIRTHSVSEDRKITEALRKEQIEVSEGDPRR